MLSQRLVLMDAEGRIEDSPYTHADGLNLSA